MGRYDFRNDRRHRRFGPERAVVLAIYAALIALSYVCQETALLRCGQGRRHPVVRYPWGLLKLAVENCSGTLG